MDFINLKSLNLTAEESEDLINLLAQKRGITTKKLLSTIRLNLKRKNNKDLASKSQQKLIKSIKSQQKLTKQQTSQRELTKSQRKLKKQHQTIKIRNSFYNIDKKLDKKINTNDDFIDNIRDLFNTNVDNKINNTNTNVDKKINNTNVDNKINNTNTKNQDFIENIKDLFNDKLENIRDLFSILDYGPVLIKSGFDNNYLEYMSNGNNSLSFNEYLELIKPYFYESINVYKVKGEWKLQLSAEISFVSQKSDSNEIPIMYTRSIPEEIIIGC